MGKVVGITSGAFYGSFLDICEQLGSKPVRLDAVENVDNFDLIILPGGSDINPEIYGQENTHSSISSYSIARDVFEIRVLENAIKLGKQVLGVCRGHQLINAALGGELLQEVSLIQRHGSYHSLESKGGIVGKIFDKVNSIHHQGVYVPGEGLTPTSLFGGVIESTESDKIISVQFHPEAMRTESSLKFFNYILNTWR